MHKEPYNTIYSDPKYQTFGKNELWFADNKTRKTEIAALQKKQSYPNEVPLLLLKKFANFLCKELKDNALHTINVCSDYLFAGESTCLVFKKVSSENNGLQYNVNCLPTKNRESIKDVTYALPKNKFENSFDCDNFKKSLRLIEFVKSKYYILCSDTQFAEIESIQSSELDEKTIGFEPEIVFEKSKLDLLIKNFGNPLSVQTWLGYNEGKRIYMTFADNIECVLVNSTKMVSTLELKSPFVPLSDYEFERIIFDSNFRFKKDGELSKLLGKAEERKKRILPYQLAQTYPNGVDFELIEKLQKYTKDDIYSPAMFTINVAYGFMYATNRHICVFKALDSKYNGYAYNSLGLLSDTQNTCTVDISGAMPTSKDALGEHTLTQIESTHKQTFCGVDCIVINENLIAFNVNLFESFSKDFGKPTQFWFKADDKIALFEYENDVKVAIMPVLMKID